MLVLSTFFKLKTDRKVLFTFILSLCKISTSKKLAQIGSKIRTRKVVSIFAVWSLAASPYMNTCRSIGVLHRSLFRYSAPNFFRSLLSLICFKCRHQVWIHFIICLHNCSHVSLKWITSSLSLEAKLTFANRLINAQKRRRRSSQCVYFLK